MTDSYSIRARIFPVYVTATPVILTLAAVLPQGLELPLAGAAAIALAPLSFLASQVGADFGKRLEAELWLKWGGPPTTRFLRHGNTEFNRVTRERIHKKLHSFGLHIPSDDERQQNEHNTDSYWEACTEELILRTRDKKKFPLVFKGLTEYGYRRNLLGLKPFGLPICLLACVVCVFQLWITSSTGSSLAVGVSATLLSFALLATWLFWVTGNTVAISSKRYARFLLEASFSLD